MLMQKWVFIINRLKKHLIKEISKIERYTKKKLNNNIKYFKMSSKYNSNKYGLKTIETEKYYKKLTYMAYIAIMP